MAERTPYRRASYDAVATTPRPPTPPTTTGLPRSDGLSRCSTAAKKASRSRCMTEAAVRTQRPPAARAGRAGPAHAMGMAATYPGAPTGTRAGHVPSTARIPGPVLHSLRADVVRPSADAGRLEP